MIGFRFYLLYRSVQKLKIAHQEERLEMKIQKNLENLGANNSYCCTNERMV